MAAAAPQLLQNLEAMAVAELEIENDAVVVVHQRQHTRLFTRRSGVNRIRLVAQHSRDQLQYGTVIIDNKNPHQVFLVWVGPIGDDQDDSPLTKKGGHRRAELGGLPLGTT